MHGACIFSGGIRKGDVLEPDGRFGINALSGALPRYDRFGFEQLEYRMRRGLPQHPCMEMSTQVS